MILKTIARCICDKTKIHPTGLEQIQKKIYELRDFNDAVQIIIKFFIFISYFTKISLYSFL